MQKMNIGQSISILANIGVIAGIIFLGYELRQNTYAIRGTTVHGISDQSLQVALADVAPDPTVVGEAREAQVSRGGNT